MDYELQLQNIVGLSNNLANFCFESLTDWEENDTDALQESDKNEEIEYTLNTIREQINAICNICDINYQQHSIAELVRKSEKLRRKNK